MLSSQPDTHQPVGSTREGGAVFHRRAVARMNARRWRSARPRRVELSW